MKIEGVNVTYKYGFLDLNGFDRSGEHVCGRFESCGAVPWLSQRNPEYNAQLVPLTAFVQRHWTRLANLLRSELLKSRGTSLSADARHYDRLLRKLEATLTN